MRSLVAAPLAGAALLWASTVVLAEPTLTVTPESGPVGTHFVNRAEGLESNKPYKFEMRLPDGTVDVLDFETATAGRFTQGWDVEEGDPTGTYTERLLSADGTVLATVTFRVTAAGAQAGAGHDTPATLPAAGDLGAVLSALATLGAGLAGTGLALRRRRTRTAGW